MTTPSSSSSANPNLGKLTLHHLNHSQSQRILWLLEELSLAYPSFSYTKIDHFRVNGEAPDSLKAVSPTGKAPYLVLPNGRSLNESTAIMTYLLRTYDVDGKFGGGAQLIQGGFSSSGEVSANEDANDWLREDELVSHASTSLLSIVTLCFVLQLIPIMSPWIVRPVLKLMFSGIIAGLRPRVKATMAFWEDRLKGREFASGNAEGKEVGMVDFVVEFPMALCFDRRILDINDFPTIKAYRERCMARPAWKEALNKGNGYDWTSYGF